MAWWSAATLVSSQRDAVPCVSHICPWLCCKYQERRPSYSCWDNCDAPRRAAAPVLAGCGLQSRKVLRAGSRLALVASVLILGFINLSHPWQNVDALSLKYAGQVTSPCGTCIAAATSCILAAKTRPGRSCCSIASDLWRHTVLKSLPSLVATSDFTLFILQRPGLNQFHECRHTSDVRWSHGANRAFRTAYGACWQLTDLVSTCARSFPFRVLCR
jgi:hypothetical protein